MRAGGHVGDAERHILRVGHHIDARTAAAERALQAFGSGASWTPKSSVARVVDAARAKAGNGFGGTNVAGGAQSALLVACVSEFWQQSLLCCII